MIIMNLLYNQKRRTEIHKSIFHESPCKELDYNTTQDTLYN